MRVGGVLWEAGLRNTKKKGGVRHKRERPKFLSHKKTERARRKQPGWKVDRKDFHITGRMDRGGYDRRERTRLEGNYG